MGLPRRQNLIKSRRRVDDDGEEEEGLVASIIEDDSLSEGSAISDADDDADAEGSDGDEVGTSPLANSEVRSVANGHQETPEEPAQPSGADQTKPILRAEMNDTEAMMNGLRVSGVEDQGVAFEDIRTESAPQPPSDAAKDGFEAPTTDSVGEKRRKEHEEYRKKRDADPAFVPNRGGFFMHDHRSAAPGQNGFRPFGRGRGRGRGGIGGPFHVITQPSGPADSPWAHDLHETVAQHDKRSVLEQPPPSGPSALTTRFQPPNRSFSRTTRIGNVQIRILLTGMSEPIIFSAVPVNQHTRLPHHRPPLRRDKPVRISLPEMQIRYIFPSTERSFIFIPRALRPNQQGFGRIRGRGSFGGGYSAFGGLSSRRTSAYAGSAYSPSVALSRRSSLAREVSVEALISPGGTAAQRMPPVVRLPPAATQLQPLDHQPIVGASMAPTVNLPQPSAYPLPQKPTFRENRPAALPMQHPKPQRTLQVADIDSPATLEFNPPQQQQQLPFHQQVPPQMGGQSYPSDYPHSRHPSHPSQASGGTPLPQIPERAIHAPPFQPYPYQHPQSFYPPQFPPPLYYYPTPDQGTGVPSAAAPAFVPGQEYHYPMPFIAAPQLQPPPQLQQSTETTQGGTVAQEINGMVYYLDPTQVRADADNSASYSAAGYTLPTGGVVGMGGMMTPPIYYPPPPPTYYPQQ